ncbi:Mitochondrial distribution/morphology family 35/apoptosis [Phaffia rhodozyma]|uniref:Mitochondrial distribution/morphology family 35/apoptosis n=1 Tax=Phaffia rhodozyma TaxID=264483 RepID=A0A0F7SHK9_PHARH|nr:Mitochondrial distribution/morphology family 35/apoptosis [Phaffia rhodozyma]
MERALWGLRPLKALLIIYSFLFPNFLLPFGIKVNPACNPYKHTYDACFIKWVEGYLEPLTGETTLPGTKSTVDPAVRAKAKAEEYEKLCGESWRVYKDCVWKAVKDKDLMPLLTQAREENPLLSPNSEPTSSK